MTAVDYDSCETRVLAHEGGYTNDPRDPGGPTNWGITIFDARKYWKSGATAADVKAMPRSVAEDIYRTKYWAALRCDALPPGVDDSAFDYGVNSGIGRSGKVLRRVVGLPDNDWHVTDQVLAAVRARDAKSIISAINDERLRFLKSLSTWDHFGAGWGRRVAEVRSFSLMLAGGIGGTISKQISPVQGKGHVPAPNHGPIVAGGGAAAAASGGLFHWLGAHPAVSTAVVVMAIAGIVYMVGKRNQSHKNQQETPMPGTPVVPVSPPVIGATIQAIKL